MPESSVPKMRTVTKTVDELKRLDPGTCVTAYYIRQLIKKGELPVVWAGSRALINLDDVLTLLHLGTEKRESDSQYEQGIRKLGQTIKISDVYKSRLER